MTAIADNTPRNPTDRVVGMSALGQKQTWLLQLSMSVLPPKADVCSALGDVRFLPKDGVIGLAIFVDS
jgi:hypothetical protein